MSYVSRYRWRFITTSIGESLVPIGESLVPIGESLVAIAIYRLAHPISATPSHRLLPLPVFGLNVRSVHYYCNS